MCRNPTKRLSSQPIRCMVRVAVSPELVRLSLYTAIAIERVAPRSGDGACGQSERMGLGQGVHRRQDGGSRTSER